MGKASQGSRWSHPRGFVSFLNPKCAGCRDEMMGGFKLVIPSDLESALERTPRGQERAVSAQQPR